MLARAGDVGGSVWALRKAEQLHPGDADLERVAAGVRTMYPEAYHAAGEPGEEPPPLASS
jgi:hypothetical protein